MTKKEIEKILDIQLDLLSDRLIEKNITIKVKQSAKEYFIQNGYNAQMGARPLRRLLQRELEDSLSLFILKNNSDSCIINVECVDNKIVLKEKKDKVKKKQKIDNEIDNKVENTVFVEN